MQHHHRPAVARPRLGDTQANSGFQRDGSNGNVRSERGEHLARGKCHASHHVDSPPHETADEPEPERDVRPSLVAAHVVLERIHRPEKRIRATRGIQSLVRVQDAIAVAIVDALGARLVPRWIIGFILRRLAYADAKIPTERDVDEYWAPTQLAGFVHAARAGLGEFDWSAVTDAEASSLGVATLVVLGKSDRLVPNTQAAVSRLNGSRIEWVPGGHCAHEEHPDLIYDMLAEFVR